MELVRVSPAPHHDLPVEPTLVNGVRIDPVGLEGIGSLVRGFLECSKSHIVHFVPADPTIYARENPDYREILNNGDLNVPDGMSVVWAMRLSGRQSERLPGTDAFRTLAAWGTTQGIRHYLWGGSPSVARRLARRLREDYPDIEIVGVESPPFKQMTVEELAETAARIQRSGTDILWVGLGAPKQDIVGDQLRAMGAAPVIMCVGAAFDFISGEKGRPPAWMQRSGLEWLGRLVSEPRRLAKRYLVGNTRFVAGVLRQEIRRRNRPAEDPKD